MSDDQTLSAERLLPASPATVFAAMTDPVRLARWWGPQGFRNEFEICEVRPGGRWVFTMIGPDGTRYANASRFVVVEPDTELLIDHHSTPHFQLRITLAAEAGGTRLRWIQRFEDAALAQAIRPVAEPANQQNLDRLAQELGLTG